MKENITILFYASEASGVEERLHKVVEGLASRRSLEVHRTMESLSERLTMPVYDTSIVVLLVANRKELMEVAAVQHLFYDVRSILILPNRDSDTMAIGHSLRPRFVTFRDSDFSDVEAVLHKMIERYHTPRNDKHERRLLL
jgi:hypothetical protein